MSVLQELREHASQFAGRMLLSEERIGSAIKELEKASKVRDTPPEDLRFIEGLADIPYGSLQSFRCIPGENSAVCACGRKPNAADIVAYALRKNVHSKQTVRDALLGTERIFEVSSGWREGGCLVCNRKVLMESYWTYAYLYA